MNWSGRRGSTRDIQLGTVGQGRRFASAMWLAKMSKAPVLQRVVLAESDLVSDLPITRNGCDFRDASYSDSYSRSALPGQRRSEGDEAQFAREAREFWGGLCQSGCVTRR